jgi:uroporphyrinogen III methyltransferase/synthase
LDWLCPLLIRHESAPFLYENAIMTTSGANSFGNGAPHHTLGSQARLPLAGKRVLVTRPRQQAEDLAAKLVALGATVALHPVIEIRPPERWSEIDPVLERLSEFELVVFASANGVQSFFARCAELGSRKMNLDNLKLAAIGSKTAKAIEQHGGRVSLTPNRADSQGLAQCLIENVRGKKLLLIRADRGSSELPDLLSQAEVRFEQIAVYRSVDVENVEAEIARAISSGEFDWVTMTSSAIAAASVKLFGEGLKSAKLVSISPTTSRQLEELGMTVAAEAKQFNMDGVVAAIVKHESL